MIITERRLDVKLISAAQLAFWMDYQGESVRSLADKVGVSRSTIGHLRSGERTTCKPAVAKKIAKVLQCPKEALFLPVSSNVSREVAA